MRPTTDENHPAPDSTLWAVRSSLIHEFRFNSYAEVVAALALVSEVATGPHPQHEFAVRDRSLIFEIYIRDFDRPQEAFDFARRLTALFGPPS